MKRLTVAITLTLVALSAPLAYATDQRHAGHDMKRHAEMKGGAAHEAVVQGVKAVFKVQTMADAMKDMGMEMPKGVKETHHVSVSFVDAGTGKAITAGEVKVKVQSPDKTSVTKDLILMHGHFGADFDMAKKGKYGVMSRFRVKDGKVREAKFWYEVK